jgi:hypothetical protein
MWNFQFEATDPTLVKSWAIFGMFMFLWHMVTQKQTEKSHKITKFEGKLWIYVVGPIDYSFTLNSAKNGLKPSPSKRGLNTVTYGWCK